MTLPAVCLGMTAVSLAFLIPAVILVAVVKVKKIKLTPLVIYVGAGIVVFVAALIVIPMGPIGRRLPWLTIVAWALGSGLLIFLATAFSDGLSHVLGCPNIGTAIKEWNSPQASRKNESCGGKDANQTEVEPMEDNIPGE
jgi:hypothetical protein